MPTTIEDLDIKQIVMEKIASEIQSIRELDSDTYGKYKVTITNERQFLREDEFEHNTIYLVVKFLEGSKEFGQQKQPFSINAMSEHNAFGVCQKLMMDFSETYNLIFEFSNAEYTLRQTMTTPSAVSNFNEVYAGFRSVFYMSGTFLIGINSNPITGITVKDAGGLNEEIRFLTAQWTFEAQPDSQPFYGTNDFNRTVAKSAALSVGFTMYAVNTDFFNGVMDLIFNKDNRADINKTYTLSISFKSGNAYEVPMKLLSVSGAQQIRDFPACTFTFMR